MPRMFSDDDLDVMQQVRDAHRSAAPVQSGQGAADAAPVRRGARSVSRAPGRAGRARRALLMTESAACRTGTRRRRHRRRGAARGSPSPTAPRSCAAALADAASSGQSTTVIRGGGTKLGLGQARWPRSIWSVSTARLATLLVHRHGDLTATVGGRRAARRSQRHAGAGTGSGCRSRAPFDGATIGGMVATNEAGPLRHRFGTPRDLLIGITLALTDGRLVKSGGTVVKNVAGYDLGQAGQRLVSARLAGDRRRDVQAAADAAGVGDAAASVRRRRRRWRRDARSASTPASSSRRRSIVRVARTAGTPRLASCWCASRRAPRRPPRRSTARAATAVRRDAASVATSGAGCLDRSGDAAVGRAAPRCGVQLAAVDAGRGASTLVDVTLPRICRAASFAGRAASARGSCASTATRPRRRRPSRAFAAERRLGHVVVLRRAARAEGRTWTCGARRCRAAQPRRAR